jgi:hypothetical protein
MRLRLIVGEKDGHSRQGTVVSASSKDGFSRPLTSEHICSCRGSWKERLGLEVGPSVFGSPGFAIFASIISAAST